MSVAAPPDAPEAELLPRPVRLAFAYHARTKHSLKAYAASPDTLDWDMQPDPFRVFEGAPRLSLPLAAPALQTRFCDLSGPGAPAPAAADRDAVALLLELSFGLSAWKELGPDRWALRCNPSSGNLHPTEAYVLTQGISGLDDGLFHYVSRDHALELRCRLEQLSAPRLLVGLSSIQWREAWKYGERAFRYCQLDIGHALGALRYAAAALGWGVRLIADVDSETIAGLLGLDQPEDFEKAEREDPELLAEIILSPDADKNAPLLFAPAPGSGWMGRANVLDPHPLYRWPAIDQVSEATHSAGAPPAGSAVAEPLPAAALPGRLPAPPSLGETRAAALILGRRSAQRFDARSSVSAADFFTILDALLPRPDVPPFDVWDFAPRLHPILFVHRVAGLPAGLYALPRRPVMVDRLKGALRDDFDWRKVEDAPTHLPLYHLVTADARGVTRTVSCHQAIASDGAFTLSMLAEFEALVAADPWRYRQLHWEAGLLGQALYLEAEAAGVRGTGIGCYFDDELHQLLGIEGRAFQSLYHFTVGYPVADARIKSEPAYPGRAS